MNKLVRLSEIMAETEVEPDIEGVTAEPGEAAIINPEHLRMLEAILFAAPTPLDEKSLNASLPRGADLPGLLAELQQAYERRGVNLVRVAEKWQIRTAPDLGFLLRREQTEQKRLSRAGIETLAIIAYHQPVTRAEIEDIRGVALSKGTVDTLMEIGWVRIRGRKRTPGRPVTYGTTDDFLVHFGLENINRRTESRRISRRGSPRRPRCAKPHRRTRRGRGSVRRRRSRARHRRAGSSRIGFDCYCSPGGVNQNFRQRSRP
jgi:segregation and condensation protein B